MYGNRKRAETNIVIPIPKIPKRKTNIGDVPIIMQSVIEKPFAAKEPFPDPIRAFPNNVEYPYINCPVIIRINRI